MTKTFIRTTVLTGFAAAMLAAGAAYADPQAVSSNGINYITGGIGLEDRTAIEAQKANFNLHVLNAGLKGHFVGDTAISIKDSKGEELLAATAGPIFYASLPAGSYSVVATHYGLTKTQRVTVSEKKSANANFAWPAPANDAATGDINATRPGQTLVAPYNAQATAPAATPTPADTMPANTDY